MIKKGTKKYAGNFETFVVNKLIGHDESIQYLKETGDKHSLQLFDLRKKVDRIDGRTEKLYDAMDAFMKEIRESREEREFIPPKAGLLPRNDESSILRNDKGSRGGELLCQRRSYSIKSLPSDSPLKVFSIASANSGATETTLIFLFFTTPSSKGSVSVQYTL